MVANNARNEAVRDAEAPDLVLTRVLSAPRALVFEAWTDPRLLRQWWGPDGFTSPRCEADARPGGAIRIDMRGPDGTVYPMSGVFREIVRPERIVFTSVAHDNDGTPLLEALNTVTFEERAGKTTVTMTVRVVRAIGEGALYLAGMEVGWTQSLVRLGEHVETGWSADHEIVLFRLVDAPRELVWEAFTDPEHVANWWGPRGFSTTTQEMDVRPGGTWRLVMHGPDGTDYPNKIVYREVVRPERLVYTNSGGRKGGPGVRFQTTVTFADEAGRTFLMLRMVFASAAEREKVIREYGALQGGRQTLDRLAEHVAKMRIGDEGAR